MRSPLPFAGSHRRLGLFAAVFLVASTCFGCSSPQGGTDVGNGRTIKLDLQAYEGAPLASTRSLELSDGVRVDAAFMVLDRVRLVPGSSCEEEDADIDIEGPLVADLLDGIVLGDPSFPTTFTEFCELKLGLHPADLADSPPDTRPELDGLSLWVVGERADGVPFTVESDIDERFELKAKDGSFALPAVMTRLIVGFRLNDWVDALGLDNLGDLPIVVNDQNNQSVLSDFEDAVKDSARLFRDQDEDGYLDDDEHDDIDELAD